MGSVIYFILLSFSYQIFADESPRLAEYLSYLFILDKGSESFSSAVWQQTCLYAQVGETNSRRGECLTRSRIISPVFYVCLFGKFKIY